MGYYASGDTRKTIHSSEDEGYENQSPHTTISFELQSQSNIIDKSNFSFGKSEGIVSYCQTGYIQCNIFLYLKRTYIF